MLSLIPVVVALLSTQVQAHGIVTKVVAGTKTYEGYSPDFQYRPTPPAVIGWTAPQTQDRGPVMGSAVNSPDVICHKGATNAKLSAEVAAGEKVSLTWTQWPDSHKGPVLDYLADCGGDCSTVDKTQLKFFKIDGVGMTGTSGTPGNYADDDMIKNGNTWTVTIPASIKAGNYVLRHETIALHEGQRTGGAQLYPQCFNLKVTGGGSDVPQGVLGTQLYTPDGPGIKFDIYKKYGSTSDYPVPGPALYTAGSTGGTAPVAAPASPAGSAPATLPSPKNNSAQPSTETSPGTGSEYGSGTTPAQPQTSGKKDKCRNRGARQNRRHVRDFQN